MISKFFVDMVHYDLNCNKIYGDMYFTFQEMGETSFDSLDDAIKEVSYGINEEVKEEIENEYEFDGTIPVYIIIEYQFKDDEENFFIQDAVGKKNVIALTRDNCLFDKMQTTWEKYYNCKIEMV